MNENPKSPEPEQHQPEELQVWETPKLVVEEVGPATAGGKYHFIPMGDDSFYAS